MVEYSLSIADEICDRLASGESLNAICKDAHMPSEKAVRLWSIENRDGFGPKYARAREFQIDHFAEELVELADAVYKSDAPDRAQIARLQLDARKWVASKIMPKKYGDRLETNNTTTLNASDSLSDLMREIAETGAKIYDPRPK